MDGLGILGRAGEYIRGDINNLAQPTSCGDITVTKFVLTCLGACFASQFTFLGSCEKACGRGPRLVPTDLDS